ncbi:hypothetical protein H0H87_008873 [Tephrocybe sp. NHM501043]|nr:hypothetical protein H0H87_008873 [Tephrocybe sp. NHM501043]
MYKTPTGDDAYDRALTTYIECLNAEEWGRIKEPTSLSSLVIQAQAMGEALARDRKKPSAVRAVADAARHLEPFEQLLEGACKMSPFAGQLIWGSVLFILQSSSVHPIKSSSKSGSMPPITRGTSVQPTIFIMKGRASGSKRGKLMSTGRHLSYAHSSSFTEYPVLGRQYLALGSSTTLALMLPIN